jgi:hypothetical protein
VRMLAHDQRKRSNAKDLTQPWMRGIAPSAAVGLGHFLAAVLSVRLILEPEGVVVFWPA